MALEQSPDRSAGLTGLRACRAARRARRVDPGAPARTRLPGEPHGPSEATPTVIVQDPPVRASPAKVCPIPSAAVDGQISTSPTPDPPVGGVQLRGDVLDDEVPDHPIGAGHRLKEQPGVQVQSQQGLEPLHLGIRLGGVAQQEVCHPLHQSPDDRRRPLLVEGLPRRPHQAHDPHHRARVVDRDRRRGVEDRGDEADAGNCATRAARSSQKNARSSSIERTYGMSGDGGMLCHELIEVHRDTGLPHQPQRAIGDRSVQGHGARPRARRQEVDQQLGRLIAPAQGAQRRSRSGPRAPRRGRRAARPATLQVGDAAVEVGSRPRSTCSEESRDASPCREEASLPRPSPPPRPGARCAPATGARNWSKASSSVMWWRSTRTPLACSMIARSCACRPQALELVAQGRHRIDESGLRACFSRARLGTSPGQGRRLPGQVHRSLSG